MSKPTLSRSGRGLGTYEATVILYLLQGVLLDVPLFDGHPAGTEQEVLVDG